MGGAESCSKVKRRGQSSFLCAVLGIRIRRIRMFLGLLDPDPDPLVRGTDPDQADPEFDPDPLGRGTDP